MKRKPIKNPLPRIDEITPKTMELWLAWGTVTVTSVGAENVYLIDSWGFEYYCKCYPQ